MQGIVGVLASDRVAVALVAENRVSGLIRLYPEPGVALYGEIKRIVGLYEPAETPRYEIRPARNIAQPGVASLGHFRLKRHACPPVANGVHVGDVVGDGFEPPLERHLSREGDVKPVLHDAVPPGLKVTPAFRGNDGSAGLSVADFAVDSFA